MPRRTPDRAQRLALQQGWTRIRCLLRNQDFRKDLIEERRQFAAGDDWWSSSGDFFKKWNLQWLPLGLLSADRSLPSTPQACEELIKKSLKSAQHDPRKASQHLWRPAVIAEDPRDKYVEEYLDRHAGDPALDDPSFKLKIPSRIPQRGTVLNLGLDLSYPQDVLEGLVKEELRKALKERQRLVAKGQLPAPPKRQRLDKVDFYLEVYDRAAGGEPYRKIATALRSSRSTVQSAHVRAMRLIGAPHTKRRPARHSPTVTWKKSDPDSYITTHLRKCQICRVAEQFDQRCDGFKSWVTSNLGLEFVPSMI